MHQLQLLALFVAIHGEGGAAAAGDLHPCRAAR